MLDLDYFDEQFENYFNQFAFELDFPGNSTNHQNYVCKGLNIYFEKKFVEGFNTQHFCINLQNTIKKQLNLTNEMKKIYKLTFKDSFNAQFVVNERQILSFNLNILSFSEQFYLKNLDFPYRLTDSSITLRLILTNFNSETSTHISQIFTSKQNSFTSNILNIS